MNVKVGPASVLGWLLAAVGLLTTTVQSLENSQALVTGPGKWPAILGVVSLTATNLGRQFQAAHLTKAAAVADDIAKLSPALEALAREAKANVSKLAGFPDHVQTASVPFSGATPAQA
jgi:hypothetical protein